MLPQPLIRNGKINPKGRIEAEGNAGDRSLTPAWR
jgi:hypothetical protein